MTIASLTRRFASTLGFFLIHAVARGACDYYASPNGAGDGRSESQPFRISKFWSRAKPGGTLCLLDGDYTGVDNMILPPPYVRGAAGFPITVRALHDGKVLIDGRASQRPVRLDRDDWFVIEGIDACCSSASVVELVHSGNNVVRRVVGWDAKDANEGIFSAHYSGGPNLFEDVAGFGTARKTFSMSQGGNDTTVRRAWGRWEKSTAIGPKLTYSLAYNSYRVTFENCLGTWSGEGMPEKHVLMDNNGLPTARKDGTGSYDNYGVDQPYGIFGADRNDRDKNADSRLLGSLAYVLPTGRFKSPRVVYFIKFDSIALKDVAVYLPPGKYSSVIPFGLYGQSLPRFSSNLVAAGLTALGGGPNVIEKQWKVDNVLTGASPAGTYARGESIFSTKRGANLCYRYQDGTRTTTPLWPWPMNQRIKDATARSGRAAVDVDATISDLFGPVPAPCRSPDSSASPSPTAVPTPIPE